MANSDKYTVGLILHILFATVQYCDLVSICIREPLPVALLQVTCQSVSNTCRDVYTTYLVTGGETYGNSI